MFSKLQQRVTMMKNMGNFDRSLLGLKDWEGVGTPKQAPQAKDKKVRDVRAFRDNTLSTHKQLLQALKEYAPHTKKAESREMSVDRVRLRKIARSRCCIGSGQK